MSKRCFRQFIATGCVLVGGMFLAADHASAQTKPNFRRYAPSLQNRPTVSPYTSLLNSNGGGNLNYYNIVKPQERAQTTARGIKRELKSVESQVQTLKRPGSTLSTTSNVEPISSGRMAPTGHRTSFGDLGGYFPGSQNSK